MSILEHKKTGRVDLEVEVPGTPLHFPVTILTGELDGPVTLVQAGLHNAEYPGIQAALELRDEIDPKELRGTLVIIPLLNRSGFENRTFSYVYEDGKNINRCFPGDPNGSETDKLCFFLENELYKDLDYMIDLHSGDAYEELNDFVYCQGNAPDEVKEKSMEMAKTTSLPFVIASQSGTGGAYNRAGTIGVPGILIERGFGGRWSPKQVNEDKEDVLNVLKMTGNLEGKTKAGEQPVYSDVVYETTDRAGLWYPAYRVGDVFEKDALLGEVRSLDGELLKSVTAEKDGFVLYQTTSLNVLEGDPLIAYVKDEH